MILDFSDMSPDAIGALVLEPLSRKQARRAAPGAGCQTTSGPPEGGPYE
jgi:hypothetical protein